MFKNPFKVVPKSFLGIDIGVSSVKVVELSRWGGKIELKNYGKVAISPFKARSLRTFRENSFLLSTKDISKVIRGILNEAKIKTREAIFTIPDFSTFFTTFELPPMTEPEIAEAVKFEARQHIPVPISDVVLDWYLIEGRIGKKGTRMKILLVAIPIELISQYKSIAQSSQLQLKFIEAETFSLARALAKNKDTVCLVDIGVQSTTVNIADEGILKVSHSIDLSGKDLTQALVRSLDVDMAKAEEIKRIKGLKDDEEKDILMPLLNLIIIEVEKVIRDFHQINGKETKKIILSGGSALLPGLKDFFSSYLKKEVEIANPFLNVSYPPVLERKLKVMGPSFAVALGAALKGIK